ncbi:MAG: O-methyltransferase [Candidatus Karelsulcia muelleri]
MLIPLKIDNYLNKNFKKELKYLVLLRHETLLKTHYSKMSITPYEGRLLSLISKLVNPKLILEIGTFTGYSTLCLAEGLKKEGKLITIEKNKNWKIISDKYFHLSPFYKKISQIHGDALKIIPNLNIKKIDLVFIDADKKNYSNYFDLVISKIKSGGIILSDNVLWHGKLFNNIENYDKISKYINIYNKKLSQDLRIENIILPIRDGLSLSFVKKNIK